MQHNFNKKNKIQERIKFGVSEFKRATPDAYIELCEAFKIVQSKKLGKGDEEKIKIILLNEGAYKEQKKSNDISREVSFSKRMKFVKLVQDKYSLDFVGEFLLSENKYNITNLEIFTIYYLLSKTINEIPYLKFIIDNANGSKKIDDLIEENTFLNKDELELEIEKSLDKKDVQKLYDLIKYLGGSGKEKDKNRNFLLKELISNLLHDDIISAKNNLIIAKDLIYNKKLINNFIRNVLNLFEYSSMGTTDKKINSITIPINKKDAIIKYLINRNTEYKWLIKQHLLEFISIFHVDNNNLISISDNYKELAEYISKKAYKTDESFEGLKDIDSFLESLNIEKLKIFKNNNKPIITEIDTNIIFDSLSQKKEWKRIPKEALNEIFGKAPDHVLYEYLSTLSIHISLKKYITFIEFKNLSNTILSSDFKPKAHAPGGRPDSVIFIDNKKYILEPTLQVYGAKKHENNIPKHIKKEKAEAAIMIAPDFNNETIDWILMEGSKAGLENKSNIIIPITNNQIVKHSKNLNKYISELKKSFENEHLIKSKLIDIFNIKIP